MKVTVELSRPELDEIQSITGITKKGPAIRKILVDALLFKRRERLSQKFISGQWGVELSGFEASRVADKRASTRRARQWKK